MAKCGLCRTAVNKLHKFEYSNKISWVCTACNSRLNNGHQLSRVTSLTRLGLLLELASIIGNLVTAKGRKALLALGGKK